MSARQKSVWDFLCAHYCGPENAAYRAVIRSRYNLTATKKIGDRKFRDIVSDLVTVFKKAICTTSSDGYFVARTAEEKNHALNYLGALLKSDGDRYRALTEADPLERQKRLPF